MVAEKLGVQNEIKETEPDHSVSLNCSDSDSDSYDEEDDSDDDEIESIGSLGLLELFEGEESEPEPQPKVSWVSDDDEESDDDKYNELYKIYMDQVTKSDGFDVHRDPGLGLMGGICRMDIRKETRWYDYDMCSKLAVEEYNRRYEDTNSKLKFVKVLMVMDEPCNLDLFYITFEAKDLADGGVIKKYQTVVWLELGDKLTVLSFRLKPPEVEQECSGDDEKKWFWKDHH